MKRSFLIGAICAGVTVLIILGVVAMLLVTNQQPVFHDVTVELGSQPLTIRNFLVNPGKRSDCAFISDVSLIDLNRVGTTPVTLRHGKQLYTVNFTVQDTTAPTVTFKDELVILPGAEAKPEDFVTLAEDLSPVSVSFVTAPQSTDTYSDQTVEVAVSDLYSNTVTATALLKYDWVHTNVQLELGEPLTKAHILLDAENDGDLISQETIDEINATGAGKYTLTLQSGESIRECTITVQDTQPPQVELRQVSIYPSQLCVMEDFIVSATDISGDVTLELLTELPFGQIGDHTVQIKATDKNGHSCIVETLLRIHDDITPPSIYGLYDIKLVANSGNVPDYAQNVEARDATDGTVDVSYDASKVDLTTPGIYYVYYTSIDKTGNLAQKARRVIVQPDYKDTEKLIADIAKSLPATDPESLRIFVRDNITYLGPIWGGDDPVGYGFTNWYGNCYVHAKCLKALLDYFGYENDLIWLMPLYNPHYWNLIKIDGVWYHIDSTPAVSHQKYSIMTNAQRLETLKGRRWDTEKWPMLNEEK